MVVERFALSTSFSRPYFILLSLLDLSVDCLRGGSLPGGPYRQSPPFSESVDLTTSSSTSLVTQEAMLRMWRLTENTSNSRCGIPLPRKITTASDPSATRTPTSFSSALQLTHRILCTAFRRRFASAVPLSWFRNSTRPQWIIEVKHFCSGVPILLVGCKKDLRHDPRIVEELGKANQWPVTPEEVRRHSSFLVIDHSCTARGWP